MSILSYVFDPDNWLWLGDAKNIRFLAGGLAITLALALLTMGFGLTLAIGMGVLSTLGPRWLRTVFGWWIDLWRNLPVLFTILYLYLVMPSWLRRGYEELIPSAIPSAFGSSAFLAALIALVLYHSSVMAEIVRAGILSIEMGQSHAAMSLGFGAIRMMRVVILPQALRRMVPALLAQLITITKDTSLASVIGVQELLRNGSIVSNTSGSIFIEGSGHAAPVLHVFLLIGVVFILGNYGLSKLAGRFGNTVSSSPTRSRRRWLRFSAG